LLRISCFFRSSNFYLGRYKIKNRIKSKKKQDVNNSKKQEQGTKSTLYYRTDYRGQRVGITVREINFARQFCASKATRFTFEHRLRVFSIYQMINNLFFDSNYYKL